MDSWANRSSLRWAAIVPCVYCSNPAIEYTDELREQIGFATLQNHAHLPPEIAFRVCSLSRGQYSLFGQLAAGAEAAVKLIEIGLRPVAEKFRMLGDTAFDERVGCPIKSTRRHPRNRLEQLIDRNAQALGQLVQRAS